MKQIKISCCFCNTTIESSEINPCEIILLSNWDKSKEKQHAQNFWCHYECFKEKLNSNIQQHLMLHLLDNNNQP